MKQFNANMLARTTEKVPLGPDAQIRENTKVVVLADSKWSTVNRVLRGIYADAIKGNVIEHVAAATGIQRQVISIDLSPSFTTDRSEIGGRGQTGDGVLPPTHP